MVVVLVVLKHWIRVDKRPTHGYEKEVTRIVLTRY